VYTKRPSNRLSVEMSVVVARPLTGDVYSDVGKTGMITGSSRGWWEVLLDGESSVVPFRDSELDPLRSSENDEQTST